MDMATNWQQTQQRVVDLAQGLDPQDASRMVPACPKWTVKDLLAHVVGVNRDALDDNVDEGLGEDWTAGHVSKRSQDDLATVLAEWTAMTDEMTALFGSADEESATSLVVDASTHEQDLRGAVEQLGARDTEALQLGATAFAGMFGDKVHAAGLPPVRLESDGDDGWSYLAGGPHDGPEVEGWAGGTNAAVGARTSLFELQRALSGRRSAAQVRAWEWTDDPTPYLELIGAFGSLRDDDLVE